MKLLIILSCLISSAAFAQAEERCKPLEKLLGNIDKKKLYNYSSVSKLIRAGQATKCDDGHYAESASDIVVQALAKDFVRTMKVAAKNDNTLNFVVIHVNSTTEPKDLAKITENALKICPKDKKPACAKVESAARFALKELSSN